MRELMDEIVAFAELEHAIDLPVRTYSSGMYMRLGFSVASHIEADVLLLDEVFAVGDEDFQRKCFGKIREFKSRGGTIVFVSHDAQAVERLCDRAVLLRQGEVVFNGETRAGDRRVPAAARRASAAPTSSRPGCASGGAERRGSSRRGCSTPTARSGSSSRAGRPATVELRVSARADAAPPPSVSIELRDNDGVVLAGVTQATDGARLGRGRRGAHAALRDRAPAARRGALPPPLRARSSARAAGSCTRSTTWCASSSSRSGARPGRSCSTGAGA